MEFILASISITFISVWFAGRRYLANFEELVRCPTAMPDRKTAALAAMIQTSNLDCIVMPFLVLLLKTN